MNRSLILREQDKYAVIKDIALKLLNVARLYSIKDFADDNAVLLAQWIYDNYLCETLEMVNRVLSNPPTSKERVWRLTPDTINEWMTIELEREAVVREREVHNQKQIEVENEWTPDRLAQWRKVIDESKGFKPSLPMTQAEILEEGQEKKMRKYFAPNEEFVIGQQLHIAWIKANFDPITGEKLPNWISEDEWIKMNL